MNAKEILLVDDDFMILELYQEHLLKVFGEKIVVQTFIDSYEACEYIEDRKNVIDLAILDLKMKGLSGIDLAKIFTKKRNGTPIIFVSGYVDIAKKYNDDLQINCSYPAMIFEKPFSFDVFVDFIKSILFVK